MQRRGLAIALLVALSMAPVLTHASYTDSAVKSWLEGRSGACCVYGVYSYSSVPDPSFNTGQSWAHSVHGATETFSIQNIYSEVGSQKNTNGQRHPFWTIHDGTTRHHYEATAVNLQPASYHNFETIQNGLNSSYWIGSYDGITLGQGATYAGTTGFRYSYSGEESSCAGCAMGYVDTQSNMYNSGQGIWVKWCYRSSGNSLATSANWTNPQPTVSGCYGANIANWNILYH